MFIVVNWNQIMDRNQSALELVNNIATELSEHVNKDFTHRQIISSLSTTIKLMFDFVFIVVDTHLEIVSNMPPFSFSIDTDDLTPQEAFEYALAVNSVISMNKELQESLTYYDDDDLSVAT